MLYCVAGSIILAHTIYGSEENKISSFLLAIILMLCGYLLIPIERYWCTLVITSTVFTLTVLSILLLIRKLFNKLLLKVLLTRRKGNGKNILHEIFRKLFHGVAFILLIPSSYLKPLYSIGVESLNFISPTPISIEDVAFLKDALILVIGGLVTTFLILEFLRIYLGFQIFSREILRGKEERSLAAYLYTAVGFFFISIIFPEKIIIASIMISLITDATAAIIGMKFGKTRILKNRTLEGCLGGFIAGVLTGIIVLPIHIVVITVLIVEIVDAINVININDNLLFPIISAISIWYMTSIF